MRAFEIHLNGKRLCVAGMEEGALLFSVGCTANKHGRGAVGLSMTGLLPTLETVLWKHRTLRKNERVRIKVVETQTVDRPKVLQQAPRDTRKYEKAHVRRMAKELGWTIKTRQGKPRDASPKISN